MYSCLNKLGSLKGIEPALMVLFPFESLLEHLDP